MRQGNNGIQFQRVYDRLKEIYKDEFDVSDRTV